MSIKVMISQPMKGLTKAEIIRKRSSAIIKLTNAGYEYVDTVFDFLDTELTDEGVQCPAVYNLAKSIEAMSKCNAVYFMTGWREARGCKIEHEVALNYGLAVMEEV